MSDITIQPYNEVFIKVTCRDVGISSELRDFFTFFIESARFHPAFKNKMWDGKIHLYNPHNALLYKGLIHAVKEFTESRNYHLTLDSRLNFSTIESLENTKTYIENLNPHSKGSKLTPMKHQIEGVNHCINHKRALLLSPTGSGKSLIMYCLSRKIQEELEPNKKILIIVPTVSLVYQLESDFKDYSSENKWITEHNCHLIFSGKEKETDKNIVISTYQSLMKLSKEYFENIYSIIIDEAHLSSAASIKGICEKCTNAVYRVGLTGTLNGMKTNQMVIEGLTGKVHRLAYTKDLMDADLLSQLEINCLVLKYSDEERKASRKLKYQDELEFLVFNERRNNFIKNLAVSLKGNTLVLFQFVEKHGKILFEKIQKQIKESGSNKKVYFIHGNTEGELRESIRQLVDLNIQESIIVASYSIFSTGINQKALNNIIFASPSKGRIRVLQSIGRQLRKAEGKGTAKLYDISDDLSWKTHKNYTLKHLFERIKIYNEEKFDYKMINIKL